MPWVIHMLRLTLLLTAGIYVTLLLAGEDYGQKRPGLLRAEAEARLAAPTASASLPASEAAAPEASVARGALAPVAPTPEPPAQVVTAAYEPAAPLDAAPAPAVASTVPGAGTPAPIFTLSTLPSIGSDRAEPAPELVAEGPAPAASAEEGQIWYVAARSANVRQGPSTATGVVGRLQNGEAVTVVGMEAGDWAHIRIEGDGLEGYIAARLLTP